MKYLVKIQKAPNVNFGADAQFHTWFQVVVATIERRQLFDKIENRQR